MTTPAARPTRPAGRPRKQDAGDTANLLRSRALELFVRHGYSGTSVRMIARAAGLSDGGLYAHFRSKRALYDDLLERAGPDVIEDLLDDAWPDRPAVPAAPAVFLTSLVQRMLDNWDEPEPRAFSLLLLREEIPARPEAVTGMMQQGADAVGWLFPEWARRGLLRDGVRAALDDGRFTGGDLVWELIAPLVLVRLVHLNGPPQLRSDGRRHAERHLAFFLGRVLPDDAQPVAAMRA